MTDANDAYFKEEKSIKQEEVGINKLIDDQRFFK